MPDNIIKIEPKRKRNELDLQTKLKLIREVERGDKSKTRVAQDFGIPLTTLVTVYKNRKKIEEQIYVGGALKKRKRVRGAKYANLEKNLLKLFRNMSECNLPLSGPLVKEKANNMSIRLGIKDFKCSNGWLQRFKLRNNLIFRKCSSENLECYNEIENDFKEEDEIEGVEDEEYGKEEDQEELKLVKKFNDEQEDSVEPEMRPETPQLLTNKLSTKNTNLHDQTLSISHQHNHNVNDSESVTLLLCCDCDKNEKIRPLIVCKCSKPRCFKEIYPTSISSSTSHQLPTKTEVKNSIAVLEQLLKNSNNPNKEHTLKALDELSNFAKKVYKEYHQLKINDFFKPKTKK